LADLDFGMARMYEALLDEDLGSQIGVFREMEEALAWLND